MNKLTFLSNTIFRRYGMKRKVFFILTIILLIISVTISVWATSRRGSSGSEVRQIQEKLKRWGYYSGSVDGIYGSGT